MFGQSEIGPVEIEERNGIFWNRLDWPSYLKCPFNADLSSLIRIVQDGWRVEPPQIIISILSDSQALAKWQNLEQIRRFQAGLVKAAASARTWIITNGLNVGAARMASEAIAAERNWQHSLIDSDLGHCWWHDQCPDAHSPEPRYNATTIFDSLEALQNLNYQQLLDAKVQPPDLPIMKSVVVGVTNSDQVVSGPFFYKPSNDFDQPRTMDLLSDRHTRQVAL